MRVISGLAKGHKLLSPTGLETRPTTDRIKEAVFSIIHNDLYGVSFLDLFSGTGAIGIEALSRGAKSCTFVDKSKSSTEIINKNINQVSKSIKNPNCKVLNLNVYDALDNLKNNKFDIIFMDPPYNENIINNVLKIIFKNNFLSSNGFIIIEQSKDSPLPDEENLNIIKVKNYGLTTIIFMKPIKEKL